MAGIKQIKGVKTRNGKPVWVNEDEDLEEYSEKSSTYDYGDGYIVTPTINPENGQRYNLDELFAHYEENGPYDMYTGEKLPVFGDIETADDYSRWRSDNLFNFDLSEQEFYTGESGQYFKQDGSETTWADHKQDAIDYMADARDKVYGFLGLGEDTGYALGGLVDAQKGIATEEGKDMANKKFQMDNKKADKDGNGELSAYEKVAGEAVQKAEADNPEQDEKYGMNCGGMMMPEEEMDPVSGNPIPLGSTASNVRDDIEIYVSEGEYVLPADVVKWHGLKHIMEMQDEAKMGLMGMFAEGLIQEVAMEHEEEISEVEETEEEDIPSEDMDVEVAAVEVDDMMDEEEETEELYPEESVLPAMIKKQKYAFIA